jgi:TusE/DsrC/DsvC family sulfur relay protein
MHPLPPQRPVADVAVRLAAIESQLATLVRQQEKTAELFAEMTPVLRAVMDTATEKLDGLEKKGYFEFGKELLGVGERIVEGFRPEDVRLLGDAVVGILQTVRAVTQPKVLEIANEASAVLENADDAAPIGLIGMVRATRDDDVQKGMAVMMDLMRHVGRAAHAVREQRSLDPADDKKARLAAALGPRRKRALGTERAPAKAPPVARAAPSTTTPTAAAPKSPPVVFDGVAFRPDGHLVDPAAWTPELALKIATAEGISLDEARWAIVAFARKEFETTSASPNIRRLTQGTALATKDIYVLFPRAPARTVAKIAGIPKPAGCI